MLNYRIHAFRMMIIAMCSVAVLNNVLTSQAIGGLFGTKPVVAAPSTQQPHCDDFWNPYCERVFLPLVQRSVNLARQVGHFELVGQLQETSFEVDRHAINTLVISDTVAYLQGYYTGGNLVTIDISNPTRLTQLGRMQAYAGYKLGILGSTLYGLGQSLPVFTSSGGSIMFTDVSDLTHPTSKEECYIGGNTGDIHIVGDKAYVTNSFVGYKHNYLQVYEVHEGNTPMCTDFLGSYAVDGTLSTIYVQDGFAYAVKLGRLGSDPPTTTTTMLMILDVRDPQHIVEVGTVPINAGYEIEVHDTIGYVTGFSGQITMVDISDKRAPNVIVPDLIPDNVHTFTLDGSTLYAALVDGGLKMYDISNPSSPQFIAEYRDKGEGDIYGIKLKDDLIYLGGTNGLQVLRYVGSASSRK